MEDRLFHLLDAYLENRLSDAEAEELRDRLRAAPQTRQIFWDYIEQHALIEDILSEARGRDLAMLSGDETFDASPAAAPFIPGPLPSMADLGPGGLKPKSVLAPFTLWAGLLVAVAAALLIALTWWLDSGRNPHLAPAAAPLATVLSGAGDVRVIDRSGQSVAAGPGASLYAGQALRVGDDESLAEVLLADGTQIALGSGTQVRFPLEEPADGKQFHLERGAIQVLKSSRAQEPPLIVTTDQARITARETRFRLYQEEHASRMELAEGMAYLESRTCDQTVEVAEGSFVVITDAPHPMVPQPLPIGYCQLRHTFLKGGDAVAFSQDGTMIVTSHFTRGWKAWSTVDGMPLGAAPGSGQRIDGLAFFAVDDAVIALSNGGMASIWKLDEPLPSQTQLRHQHLRHGDVSADGRWLAQGSSSGEVAIWEADAEHNRISLRQSLAIKPIRVALSCLGPHVAVSRWSGEIHVFEVKTGRQVAEYKLRRTPAPLALSTDNRFLAAYTALDGLVLFDQQTGVRQTLWAAQGARVCHLCFSADGQVLLAGLGDGTVRAWSTADGQSLLVLETGHRHINKVAVSADLSLLATVGDGDGVKVWECEIPR
ncbi:MAG: FecR domain-containing protein [Gemmataceae bacterium]